MQSADAFRTVSTHKSPALKPTQKLAEMSAPFNLETLVPKQFSDWQIKDEVGPIMVSPSQQAVLASIYRQTLARTYQNSAGNRIMLSIAYGGDQSDKGVHRPEVCYTAQGFQIQPGQATEIDTRFGKIPATRLETRREQRIEPITYWITVGDRVYRNTFEKRWLELEYSLKGYIPYEVVFRVSSVDADKAHGFAIQADFIHSLVNSLDVTARQRIAGIAAQVLHHDRFVAQ